MDRVSVSILRYVADSFPGFVECLLVDADGREHHFIEKVPVIGGRPDLSIDSVFPQPGHIGCTVQDEWIDERGRELVRVHTLEPWGIESTAGAACFTVLRDQMALD